MAEEPVFTKVKLELPTCVVDLVEEMAAQVNADPPLLAAVCLIQGLSSQLKDNGQEEVAGHLHNMAALMVHMSPDVIAEVRVYPEPYKEMVQ